MPGTEIESFVVPEGGMYAEMALAPQRIVGNEVYLGSWATQETITSINFVRNNLAVTPQFKETILYVQRIFIPENVRVQTGIAGSQIYRGVIYPEGTGQIQILNIVDKREIIRIDKPRQIE